jgi:hypothetical protein
MTLREYYKQLEQHDWYYEWSDDFRVWQRGRDDKTRLEEISKLSSKHESLFIEYTRHKFSGKPWGTEKSPKPDLPEE